MIGQFFDLFLINPLTNLFVFLTAFTGNAGLAVIVLTILIRALTLPLTLKQMRSTRAMAAMAPRMQEIQKRYKDPKRRSEEQMKLYRELGINPLGCFSSMLIQMPILFALYGTFRLALGTSPEALLDLSGRLYPWSYLRGAVPLPEHFLWLSLGKGDPTGLALPLMVGLTTYVLQKMSTLPPTDQKQAAQNSMMNVMMPLIFAFITINLPSGLGLYYVLSNVIGMVLQYMYVGRGAINWRALVGLSQEPVLPRALQARTAAMEAARGTSSRASEEEPAEEKAPSRSAAAARRRRYASGRRRGRR